MIRQWNKDDIKKLTQIEKECFKVPWTENMLISEYVNPLYKCFVYEEDGEILGFIGFWEISGQVDISNIAVSPGHRKKGVGKQLISSLLNFCGQNKIKNLSLEVRAGNIAAINLYKNFGFAKEGVRKNYYEGSEDALIMWLHL